MAKCFGVPADEQGLWMRFQAGITQDQRCSPDNPVPASKADKSPFEIIRRKTMTGIRVWVNVCGLFI